MVKDFITGVPCEIGKIIVHHGDGCVFFDDDGCCSGIFKQRSVKLLRARQFFLNPFILAGL